MGIDFVLVARRPSIVRPVSTAIIRQENTIPHVKCDLDHFPDMTLLHQTLASLPLAILEFPALMVSAFKHRSDNGCLCSPRGR